MKKVLITGGTGFLGKNLVSLLPENEDEYYVLTSKSSIESGQENISYIRCNLLDRKNVDDVVSKINATHLLHMAWGIEPSNYNLPTNFDWIKASIGLVESFHNNGGKRVIITGSGVEYNWDYGSCIEELTPISNETLYGASKNILRQYIESYCKEFNLEFVWPRLFFLYGPNEHPVRLISHVITALLKGENARIMNPAIYRDYMYIKDTVRILIELLSSEFAGTINVSTGLPTKLGDMGNLIANIIGRPELLTIDPPKLTNRRVVYANVNKQTNELGVVPEYSLEQGLTETIDWWKKNINTI